jgi:hypothetical protein
MKFTENAKEIYENLEKEEQEQLDREIEEQIEDFKEFNADDHVGPEGATCGLSFNLGMDYRPGSGFTVCSAVEAILGMMGIAPRT